MDLDSACELGRPSDDGVVGREGGFRFFSRGSVCFEYVDSVGVYWVLMMLVLIVRVGFDGFFFNEEFACKFANLVGCVLDRPNYVGSEPVTTYSENY